MSGWRRCYDCGNRWDGPKFCPECGSKGYLFDPDEEVKVGFSVEEAEHFLAPHPPTMGRVDGGFIDPEMCSVCRSMVGKFREALVPVDTERNEER